MQINGEEEIKVKSKTDYFIKNKEKPSRIRRELNRSPCMLLLLNLRPDVNVRRTRGYPLFTAKTNQLLLFEASRNLVNEV